MIKLISGSAAEPATFGLFCIAAKIRERHMGCIGLDSDIFHTQLYPKKLA